MRKMLRDFLFTFSLCAIIIFAAAIIMLLFGLRPFILTSGSMEPLYKKGSLVLVNTRAKPEDLNISDVIVYRTNSDALVMHRLIDENTLKGDANQSTEHVILTNLNFVGKVSSIVIPGLGSLAGSFLSVPWLAWIGVLICIVLSCLSWKRKPLPAQKSFSNAQHKTDNYSTGVIMEYSLKPGTRIRLLHMEDPYPLPAGCTGSILGRDTNGDFEIQWDNGSMMKLIPGIDQWEVIQQ